MMIDGLTDGQRMLALELVGPIETFQFQLPQKS